MFGEKSSDVFHINIELPPESSLSWYLFIKFHCDLVQCTGTHSRHLFKYTIAAPLSQLVISTLLPVNISYRSRRQTLHSD
jgi:hypothetical protein